VAIIVWVLLILGAQPVFGDSNDYVDVLVLHSFGSDLPWTQSLQAGLRRTRMDHPELRFFVEYMDASRRVESLTHEDWAVYLQAKYANVRFDAAIADSEAAAALLLEYPDLFGVVPTLLFSEDQIVTPPHQRTLVPAFSTSARSTARLALEQNPGAQTAVLIYTREPTYDAFFRFIAH
jgi:hypothetical protein